MTYSLAWLTMNLCCCFFSSLQTTESSSGSKVPNASLKTTPKARFDMASGYTPGDEFSMKLSRINGAINKMTKEQIQEKLASIGLNTGLVETFVSFFAITHEALKVVFFFFDLFRLCFCSPWFFLFQ